jgi:septin 7
VYLYFNDYKKVSFVICFFFIFKQQTRAAREAFLRGTISNTTTSASALSSNSFSSASTSVPNSSSSNSTQSASNLNAHHTAASMAWSSSGSGVRTSGAIVSTVTSIVTNSNRELVTDKATLMASLNNMKPESAPSQPPPPPPTLNGTTSMSANVSGHLYQNVTQLKPIQNTIITNGEAHKHIHQASKNAAPIHSVTSSTTTGIQTNGVNTTSLATGSTLNPTTTSSLTSSKQRTLDGYVGFANLPNQVYRKSVKRGFEFNLMVVGESGLGKSTFINSLFLTELYNPNDFPGTFDRRKKTTYVDSSTVMLTEKGVNLRLTIVDTPGFGDSIDNTNCWLPIVDYLDSKYEEYLNAESKVNRKLPINDQRIHCCLYFIAPGHTLKQLDIEVMKKLHDRVNLIPVIAKADTMTPEEIKQFKQIVLNSIAEQKLQIYEFPDIDDDDIENNRTNNILKSKLPFAIVGSNTTVEHDGKNFRGRQYPWGVVNVDELSHCDFMALRTMLIRTHMQDLKDVTNNVHYENYRFKKLAYVAGDKAKPNNK